MARKAPTRKQRNLAKLTLENPTLPKGQLVALGGYDGSVVKNPRRALEAPGYLQALDEFGLTEELLTKSLVSDIKAKPKNRKPELELGYKVRGLLNPDVQPNSPTTNNFVQIVINAPDKNGQRIERPEVGD